MRQALFAACAALVVAIALPASAQDPDRSAVVIVLDGASLPDLLAEAELETLASIGGAALMNGRADLRQTFPDTFLPPGAIGRLPFTYVDLGQAEPSEVVDELETLSRTSDESTLVMVVATSSAR